MITNTVFYSGHFGCGCNITKTCVELCVCLIYFFLTAPMIKHSVFCFNFCRPGRPRFRGNTKTKTKQHVKQTVCLRPHPKKPPITVYAASSLTLQLGVPSPRTWASRACESCPPQDCGWSWGGQWNLEASFSETEGPYTHILQCWAVTDVLTVE